MQRLNWHSEAMADNQWTGVDRALEKMRTLSPKLQKKGLKKAVRAGTLPWVKAAKANWRQIDDPSTPQKIADNVITQFSGPLSKKSGGIAYRVGVAGGASEVYANTKQNRRIGRVGVAKAFLDKSTTWYWRFLELGTSKMAAKSPMRRAQASNIDAAINAVVKNLEPAIDKILKDGK